jgi:hypothetical protein
MCALMHTSLRETRLIAGLDWAVLAEAWVAKGEDAAVAAPVLVLEGEGEEAAALGVRLLLAH